MSGVSGISGASTLDPVEAAKDDVDRSRRLIAETLDDLTQHHTWLETYHRDERRRAERLRRQEALERLELRRQRALWVMRRLAVRAYASSRAGLNFAVAKSLVALTTVGNFLRLAAPRATRLARQTVSQLSTASTSSASWIWGRLRLISVKSYALLECGFLWSVQASEKAGIVFRRKVWRHGFIPAALLGRKAAHLTAPARRRAVILLVRTRRNMGALMKTSLAGLKNWLETRLAATVPSIKAGWTGATRRGAIGWAQTRLMTRSLLRRLRRQLAGTETSIKAARKRTAAVGAIGWARTRITTRSLVRRLRRRIAGTTDAIKAGWQKHARAATVQFARTRRTAAVLERRTSMSVIRTVPRIRHFLAQHTPAPIDTKRRGRALIVRPNTALVCAAPAPKSLPSLHSA